MATACSRSTRVAVDRPLAYGELLPAVAHADGSASSLDPLVGPATDANLGQGVENAVFAGRAKVVHGSRQHG